MQTDERDPSPGCASCENADRIDGESLFVFCRLQKLEISAYCCCSCYIYDLKKRIPPNMIVPYTMNTVVLEPIDF